jgi:hypothetical protein
MTDIDNLVLKFAPSDNEHDKSFAAALREVADKYSGKDRKELLELQIQAKEFYRIRGNTHHAIASCLVLNDLLEEA